MWSSLKLSVVSFPLPGISHVGGLRWCCGWAETGFGSRLYHFTFVNRSVPLFFHLGTGIIIVPTSHPCDCIEWINIYKALRIVAGIRLRLYTILKAINLLMRGGSNKGREGKTEFPGASPVSQA